MRQAIVYRSWPHNETLRLKELWWSGKSAEECAIILRISSPRAVRDKVKYEGFLRDPHLSQFSSRFKTGENHPQARADGNYVTVRNCAPKECRWPYGEVGADMVMCGRPVSHEPYCKMHHEIAGSTPRKTVEETL